MKKTLLLLALTLTMVFSLFSCNIFGGKEDQPDDDPVEIENLIYNKESELYIVYNPEEFKDEDISKITDAFFNLDIQPRAWSPSELPKPHEIVIGNVGREISNTAYQRLERITVY